MIKEIQAPIYIFIVFTKVHVSGFSFLIINRTLRYIMLWTSRRPESRLSTAPSSHRR